jgi:two-component system phosphate regulon sensor histidine kinase PhoR
MVKFKKIHTLSLKIIIATLALFTILVISFYYYFDFRINFSLFLVFCIIFFTLTFFLLKYIFENFIKKEIENIYNSSSLFDDIDTNKKNTTDLEVFFTQVKDFIEEKRHEIEKLNTRDDFRREFLGNVSHELKTPLFTAQGYVLTLLDNTIDDKKLQRKYLERANKSIERLNFVVKDLDMISKLESGMKLNFETFNIIKLISDVFEMFELKARKKNIVLTFDDPYEFPLLVRADKERVEQVLINLIANSINYGKENGMTTISVRSYSKTKFIVKIADNGIGIEPKIIPRLFERFYRVDKSRSREQGGSGLGLAIVKHIVEAHHQNIFAESTPTVGSSFSFTLEKVT